MVRQPRQIPKRTAKLIFLNEDSATFISPATGGFSAPDISICGADIAPKITWTVYLATLGSDHHPILMDIEVPGPKGQNKPKKNMAYKKANWDTFQRQIDITLYNPQTNLDPNENSDKMNAKLTNIIIDSAKKSIPVGSSRNRKPWWNVEIDTAVKERTALKARANHSDEDRKALFEKCSAVKKLITDSNRQSWRDFATKLNARSDPSKVWKAIRAIDGRGKRAPEGAAMEVNGQLITSSQKKADQFAKMYKEVSEVRHQKLSLADSVELIENINRDRQYVRIVRRVANSECSCPPDSYCAPFNKTELDVSLAQLKNTSPGDDQIHNKLLTHLPPSGKMALLTLFNRVYKSGQYPAAWRKGTIIPILKAGKDPAFMSSYQSIQLTSCLGKLFEKLVKVRMNYWLERRGQTIR
ncbi:hypothetical protein ElyMa_005053600 [Elysia marginata]|uniref:Endonuclease/exonuclease/phosphatase domain-containing protein n=1 Tax=Elysia marginata TaxID=1093978 RepID=A0AAV4JIB4_9GAST|nr:hypothetical protein ElyMa_005053600 [Elysia marginata]